MKVLFLFYWKEELLIMNEYKPYHRHTPITKAEEEVDEKYGDGHFDNGPDPFPFDGSDTEDDYGDDSWA